ncbi:MAG: hypothetical protein WCI94_21215 [Rhodospirillales bacterium]
MRFVARRLVDRPIVGPDLHPSIGVNIQGPSLIRVPDWIPNRLGRYYLYFVDHKGSYIRLAFADDVAGPWTIHPPGSLHLADSGFPTEPPPMTDAEFAVLEARWKQTGARLSHDLRSEFTTPHIASPDVHVDAVQRRIVMYFHGLEGPGCQVTRRAISTDGIDFVAEPDVLVGRSYLRVFQHRGETYGLAMPGQIYRNFEPGPILFNPKMRHAALLKRDDTLYVFWTQVGDAPESILVSQIDLSGDWRAWRDGPATAILRPEHPWEGADAPNEPSIRSTAYGRVNQLRDPAILEDDGCVYLLYAVGGESGIAIAALDMQRRA